MNPQTWGWKHIPKLLKKLGKNLCFVESLRIIKLISQLSLGSYDNILQTTDAKTEEPFYFWSLWSLLGTINLDVLQASKHLFSPWWNTLIIFILDRKFVSDGSMHMLDSSGKTFCKAAQNDCKPKSSKAGEDWAAAATQWSSRKRKQRSPAENRAGNFQVTWTIQRLYRSLSVSTNIRLSTEF